MIAIESTTAKLRLVADLLDSYSREDLTREELADARRIAYEAYMHSSALRSVFALLVAVEDRPMLDDLQAEWELYAERHGHPCKFELYHFENLNEYSIHLVNLGPTIARSLQLLRAANATGRRLPNDETD